MTYFAVIAENDFVAEASSFQSAKKIYDSLMTSNKAIVKIISEMDKNTYLATSEVHFLIGDISVIEDIDVNFHGTTVATVSEYILN